MDTRSIARFRRFARKHIVILERVDELSLIMYVSRLMLHDIKLLPPIATPTIILHTYVDLAREP